jgi:hypothetical protein
LNRIAHKNGHDKTSTIIMALLLYNKEVLVPEVNDDDIFYNIIIDEEEGGEYDGDESFTTTACSHSFTSVAKSGSSNSKTVHRSVSFSEKAQVYFSAIIHIDDYTPTEKYNCWYRIDELRQIRKENMYILSLMDSISSSSLSQQLHYCTRGLESKTRIGKRNRKHAKKASVFAVLDEQYQQQQQQQQQQQYQKRDNANNNNNNFDTDPVLIAMAYSVYSYPMQIAAYHRALRYQKEEGKTKAKTKTRVSSSRLFFDTNNIDAEDDSNSSNSNSNSNSNNNNNNNKNDYDREVSSSAPGSPTSVANIFLTSTTSRGRRHPANIGYLAPHMIVE